MILRAFLLHQGSTRRRIDEGVDVPRRHAVLDDRRKRDAEDPKAVVLNPLHRHDEPCRIFGTKETTWVRIKS